MPKIILKILKDNVLDNNKKVIHSLIYSESKNSILYFLAKTINY